MGTIQEISFMHNGKQYIIEVSKRENNYEVRALLNGKPVNPWVYSMDSTTATDYCLRFAESVCDHLVEIAKSDVIENRWEELKELLNKRETETS